MKTKEELKTAVLAAQLKLFTKGNYPDSGHPFYKENKEIVIVAKGQSLLQKASMLGEGL